MRCSNDSATAGMASPNQKAAAIMHPRLRRQQGWLRARQ